MRDSLIWLGLGSNVGDRAAWLRQALHGLQTGGFETLRLSPVFETPPWGLTEQASFFNMVAGGRYRSSPQDLMRLCLAVEASLGRERKERWGPRTIDIDILLFRDEIVQEANLQIPHPRLAERLFVLVPLAAAEAGIQIPGKDSTIEQILSQFDVNELNTITKIDLDI